jgi:hypothetical protein
VLRVLPSRRREPVRIVAEDAARRVPEHVAGWTTKRTSATMV